MNWLDKAGRAFTGTRHPYAVLVLLCLALWLPGFFSLPPSDRDESRFAQATKQMLETGDFVRIRFGEVARNRKPVGIHWMQAPFAAAARATGIAASNPIWPYRIPSLLGGIAAVLLTFGLGKALVGREAAMLAAAGLAATVLLAVETHIAKTDSVLTALTAASMLLLARAYLTPRDFSAWQAAGFWLAMGVAVLVKGPVVPLIAALTAATLAVADRHTQSAGWFKSLRPSWGVPLMLVVVLPWFIAIWFATGGQFFRDSLGGDLGGKLAGGAEAHWGPPGYYLIAAPALLFPLTVPVLLALPGAIRERATPIVRFLLAWIVPMWLVLEFVPTKLPHYVLPLFPALLLLAARFILALARSPERMQPFAGKADRWMMAAAVFGCVLTGLGLGLGGLAVPWLLQLAPVQALLLGVPALVAAYVLLRLGLAALDRPGWMRACIAMPLLTATLLGWVLPSLPPVWIAPRVVAALDAHWPDGRPRGAGFGAYGFHEPSMVFLAGTDTELSITPGAAVAFLRAAPGNVMLVADRQRARFLAEAARVGIAPKPFAEVTGFDYAAGRKVRLTLFSVPSPGN